MWFVKKVDPCRQNASYVIFPPFHCQSSPLTPPPPPPTFYSARRPALALRAIGPPATAELAPAGASGPRSRTSDCEHARVPQHGTLDCAPTHLEPQNEFDHAHVQETWSPPLQLPESVNAKRSTALWRVCTQSFHSGLGVTHDRRLTTVLGMAAPAPVIKKAAKKPKAPAAKKSAKKSPAKKEKKEKVPRAPSAYNLFMKSELAKVKKADPSLDHKAAFTAAAGNWASSKSNPKNKK